MVIGEEAKSTDAKSLFSGKASGITFDKFDEKVLSWGRKKFGEKYARALWRNTLLNISDLDLEDELDKFKFEEHCQLMYDVIFTESPKYADSLLGTKRFESKKFQMDLRQRMRERLFCHIETLTTGEADRQLHKRGVSTMATMREFFFIRFGAGQPEIVKERERIYLQGMPNSAGEAFAPRCNIEDKLDSLEEEREFLLDMCPLENQDSYDAGKESTLVRILLRTLPSEYDMAVKSVQDLVRLRKASVEGQVGSITNLEDNVRKNYSADWLPKYDELRSELIATWRLMERRRDEQGKNQKKGHPTLPILPGHDQPGPHQRKCYGCGKSGHMRGDASCSAGPNGVWDGAPQIWKDRVKKSSDKGGGKSSGKGKGQQKQRNAGKRDEGKGQSNDKLPCHNWSRGNGFCKYAEACRFSHDGPKGDQTNKSQPGGKRKGDAVFLATKKGKKARKKLTSLLLKDRKEDDKAKSKSKDDDSEDEDHLYQLIRGVPSVIVKNKDFAAEDFIPKRGSVSFDMDVDMVSESGERDRNSESSDAESNETVFTITLMMTNRKGDPGKYVPKRESTEDENDKDEVQIKSEINNNDGRVIKNESTNHNLKSESFPNKPEILDADVRIAAWKKRAQRAERLVIELLEEKHKPGRNRSEEHAVERVGQRARLKDSLNLLLSNDIPLEPDPEGIEYLVVRRINRAKDWIDVDFVDGDVEDEFKWCEGPFHQGTSIRELFGMKHRYDRSIRRRISGRKKIEPDDSSSEDGKEESKEDSSSASGSDRGNDGAAPSVERDVSVKDESDGTEDYEQESSSTAEASREWVSEKNKRARQRVAHHSKGGFIGIMNGILGGAKIVKERDLSPGLPNLKWIRSKGWKEDFREMVKPSVPGVDAESLLRRPKTRAKGVSFEQDGDADEFTSKVKGFKDTPVPLWVSERVAMRKIDVVSAIKKKLPCCSGDDCKFKASLKRHRDPVLMVQAGGETFSLHPLNYVGMDTCSARSVSSEVSDFLYIDRSCKARNSISLNGVGEGGPEVLGRGPMLIATADVWGKRTFMVDPSGVLVASSNKQARLRIYGQQRMVKFGFNVVQEYSTGRQYLNYRDRVHIPLTTTSGILMVETVLCELNESQREKINKLVDDIIAKKLDHYCFQLESESISNDSVPCLVMNLAKLSRPEIERIYHWRHAHRSPYGERYQERCHTCEASKHKGVYKRNAEFNGTNVSTNVPYWRLYSDAYGGQRSMGPESYEGGIGGFVFACPVSGKIKAKIYSTLEQYPAVLYQVLQEIESEGYVTREIYCDAAAVNLSQAVEEVAEMFKVRIIPISGGTPQELAYAESAVRTLGQMSRSLMLGAPHLPGFVWGMSDMYAAWIHMTMPQKMKGGKSPYEILTGRMPDDDVLFIRVFGCPVQYEPAYGVEHKRAPKTEWGWFVGVQWPMVLILRPADNKVLSISRKKVYCHELMYAKYDAEKHTRPQIDFKDFTLNETDVDKAIQKANAEDEISRVATQQAIGVHNNSPVKGGLSPRELVWSKPPDHVLSVKSLGDANRNQGLLAPEQESVPVNMAKLYHEAEGSGECEDFTVPEALKFQGDLLLDDINKMKARLGEGTLADSILKAIKKVEEKIGNAEITRGHLKRQKIFKSKKLDPENIIETKRQRKTVKEILGLKLPNIQPMEKKRGKGAIKAKLARPSLKADDRVKIRTECFGKEYAVGRSIFTYGKVVKVNGTIVAVQWDNKKGGAGVQMDARLSQLQRVNPIIMLMRRLASGNVRNGWPIKTVKAMLPILEVGSALAESDPNANGNWPKDFIEAMIRPDWRSWVDAVKSENDSWDVFEACSEIPYGEIEVGASVIPLGELFTIKRSGKYKFRQIAMGNMLKEGKDYGETFASTVSGDGLRWFCSLATTCGMEVRGWDATTGYLQTKQRVPVYAYLPSHFGYSGLEYEELAKLREKLILVLKVEGMKGIKDFSRRLRNERRMRPRTVLKLNRSVYGIPDAGQSFSMFMQGLHIKQCGLMQTEMDPCIYYKIMEESGESSVERKVTGFLIVITWVDDCRYFGTKDLVEEYEKTITKNCKCTLEGVSKEFVSIKLNHDLDNGTMELTQEDYWVKAVERFGEFLGEGGPKNRNVPLSPLDEKKLGEPSEEEIKAAEHLPYPNLLGVVQYPSNFTKVEMKYAMSVMSRSRAKWGINHFEILLKCLEYGYSTRKLGILYQRDENEEERNKLVAYADASFNTPRSQGCRLVMMNGAAISYTSKKHTTTDDSTTAAELTEGYLCACDVEGFRNLNDEIGLTADGPTVMFQDNQAAIQIMMNRGSLSRKTRATDIRTLTVRNKVEDLKIVPIYLETTKMIADLGTKALDAKQFVKLRNEVCGYVGTRGEQILNSRNF